MNQKTSKKKRERRAIDYNIRPLRREIMTQYQDNLKHVCTEIKHGISIERKREKV